MHLEEIGKWSRTGRAISRGDVSRVRPPARHRAKLTGENDRFERFSAADGSGSPVLPRDTGVTGLRCDSADIIELVGMSIPDGGAIWVRANSRSMEPTIPLGADIRLVWAEKVGVGSVVLAKVRESLLVLHRVHAIEGDLLYLRGDGSGKSDPPVRISDVLARADIISINGQQRTIGARPVVSIVDLKRWLRPITKRLRRLWRAI